VDARGEAAGAAALPAAAVAVAQSPWILASFGAEEHCFRYSSPRSGRDLCGQTALDAESSRDLREQGLSVHIDLSRRGVSRRRVSARLWSVDQGHVHGSRANARGKEIEPRAFALDRRGGRRRGSADSDPRKVHRQRGTSEPSSRAAPGPRTAARRRTPVRCRPAARSARTPGPPPSRRPSR
jgi:hypothetical protein